MLQEILFQMHQFSCIYPFDSAALFFSKQKDKNKVTFVCLAKIEEIASTESLVAVIIEVASKKLEDD